MAYGTLNAGTITPGSGNTLAISEAVTVPTPTATTHATTKAYVDSAASQATTAAQGVGTGDSPTFAGLTVTNADSGLKQYDQTDFSVTSSPAVSTLYRGVAIPYRTSTGAWRLRFNIVYSVASASRTSCTMTISGVTFKNISGLSQHCVGSSTSSANIQSCYANPNTGNVFIEHASASTSKYGFSGDVELDSKPTWAD
tara:strand:- start:1656 stop:2249 length:594 start_codon:yes stop_codon:yes gene_type:complete